MQRTLSLALWLSLAATALSQTVTVPDPDGSGNSIIENITIDPVAGLPTTIIIQTIAAGAAPPPAAPTDPAGDPNQQGPVAAPPVTNTAPPTLIYTYTTTDAAGGVETFTQIFTPTYALPNPSTPLTSGSIWDINQYTKSYGSPASTKTGTSSAASLRLGSWSSFSLVCTLASVAVGGLFAVI